MLPSSSNFSPSSKGISSVCLRHNSPTPKGTNILWINRNSQPVQRYLSTLATIAKSDPADSAAELAPLAADWLEILAHEATHMDDDSDCFNLHDAQFYNQTAHQIERMFTQPGSGRPHGYELFQEALAQMPSTVT